jgi:hypothetical protein
MFNTKLMKNEIKDNQEKDKRPKIVLPKVNIEELATLKEGKPWPKKSK